MKRLFVTLLAVGVLFSTATASRAITVTLTTLSAPANDWLGFVTSTTGLMDDLLLPQNGGTPFDVTPSPFATVTWGQALGFDFLPTATANWNNVEAWYKVAVHTSGDATDQFVVVKGKINGAFTWNSVSGNYGGGATWVAYQLVELGADDTYGTFDDVVTNTTVADPISGVIPHLYTWLSFADGPVNLYIEKNRNIPVPNQANQLTGVVTTVPEPGTLAMLFGSSVVGTLVFIRRRRA